MGRSLNLCNFKKLNSRILNPRRSPSEGKYTLKSYSVFINQHDQTSQLVDCAHLKFCLFLGSLWLRRNILEFHELGTESSAVGNLGLSVWI